MSSFPRGNAPAQSLRVGTIALAFGEGMFGRVFGNEGGDRQVGPRLGEPFALRGIGRNSLELERRLAARRSQHDPERGRARIEILAIAGALRSMELDLGAAGEEAHGIRLSVDFGPGRRCRDA